MNLLKKIFSAKQPNGTVEFVHIEDIKIPPDFTRSPPRRYKVENAKVFYQQNGCFDKPISLIAETNEKGKPNKLVLVDGFARYKAALRLGIKKLPVTYVDVFS